MLSDAAEAEASPAEAAINQAADVAAAPLIPSKPPLRVEDGLVEVGWDGDAESDLEPEEEKVISSEVATGDDAAHEEEPVDDPYAALQAWNEWTGHQARAARDAGAVAHQELRQTTGLAAGGEETMARSGETQTAADAAAGTISAPGFRAEPQQEFAPYSQLFTRIRQSKQPEG